MGGVLVQLEQLGEEEVRGYLYPPPNVTVRSGYYSGLKGGGLSLHESHNQQIRTIIGMGGSRSCFILPPLLNIRCIVFLHEY
jgi:hypothetical protein